ncbi:MAG: matrixin family metalloprotease, partial [bacterium]
VRAMDDFGNLSEISEPISTRARGMKMTGTVRDAVTDEPIPDITVRLLSSVDTTNTDGSFLLTELPAGFGQLYFWDELIGAEYGEYFDVIYQPYEIRDNYHLNVWLLPNTDLDTDDYANFLEFFYEMTTIDGAENDVLGTWETPCPVYVPPLVTNNVDYEQTIKGVFQEWEDLIGADVWKFVDAVPDTGVYVDYLPNDVSREHYMVTVADQNKVPIQGRISLRTIYDDTSLALFKVVVRHEVGHALGMNHSTDPYHIMVGGRLPIAETQSADEVKLGRAMYRIPRYSNLRWFKYN